MKRDQGPTILQCAAFGVIAGASFGGLDVCLSYWNLPGYRPMMLMLLAWLVATLGGAACGVLVGSLLRVLNRGLVRQGSARGLSDGLRLLGPLLALYALVLLVVNFHLLRVYLPDLLSARVIGANGVLALTFAAHLWSVTSGRWPGSTRLARRLVEAGPRLVVLMLVGWGLVFTTLVWATGGFATSTRAGAGGDRPSVIWLVLDTTRADSLSCYGGQRVTTPALDRLAEGGVRFEKAYAAASWTLPSHASMFTGTHPSTHGLTGLVAQFDGSEHLAQRDLSEFTAAEVLREDGYSTVAFSENPWVSTGTSLGGGFDEFHDVWNMKGRRFTVLERALKKAQGKGWLPWSVSRYTVASMKRWLAAQDPETPFFMFVNFLDPHAPYTPARPHRVASVGDAEPSDAVRLAANDPMVYVAGEVEMTPDDFELLRGLYEAEVAYLDDRIDELVGFLGRSRCLEEIILIVTSDHGENFGWQHLTSHAFALNDDLLHVPLILHAPRLIPSGTTVGAEVSLVDLFPTILELTGVPFEHHDRLEGRSVVTLLGGEGSLDFEQRPVFAEEATNLALLDAARNDYPSFDWTRYERPLKAVRRGGVKYVWSGDGRHSLYDLNDDPAEQHNLWSDRPEQAAELNILLDEWQEVLGQKTPLRMQEPVTLDPEVEERLRSLGYIQ